MIASISTVDEPVSTGDPDGQVIIKRLTMVHQ